MNRQQFQILNDIVSSLDGATELELSTVRAALLLHTYHPPQPMFLSRYHGWIPFKRGKNAAPRIWLGIPPTMILQAITLATQATSEVGSTTGTGAPAR